ncbi:hypothetical protein [Acinetobacter sp. ANC 3813]|uniref:hypothetical protein n=1 Tax=Acinetobacter sp. ANC 3813 TaxID=1977873 RepID=UPI000A33214E|nr:hypothetical protein [Acinetobacter sp. ANC 3813]OTG91811.1 hypothetical protein B9T34_00195 [Acinetobacter sp. ANC 3813]
MKKNFLFLVGGFFVINLVGCQQIQTAADSTTGAISKGVSAYDGWVSKGTQRVWDEMLNKDIRNKFLVLLSRSNNNVIILNQSLMNDKFKLEKRTMGSIYLEKYINHEANFNEANQKINNGIYISEKDLASKMFIEQALAKGHQVRMYKKNINSDLNRGLVQSITEFNGAVNRYDVDPAFVEFDKDGSPIAIMTRSWQTISAIGVDSRIYTNIYFTQDALRWFENNFSNRYLEDSLIRTYK